MTSPHTIIPAALADYCESVRRVRIAAALSQWQRGNDSVFESVVVQSCEPSQCDTHWTSSRVCELGTKCCNVIHSTSDKLKDVAAAHVRKVVKQCGTQMKAAERLDISVGTVRNYLTAALMLVATCSFGQRGTLTPVVQPTISTFNLSPAPSPAQSMSLTWDNVAPSYRVQVGATRGNWTNSFTILTNRFVLTNGQCYAVRSIAGGIESSGVSLWPSNRIGEIWLRGMGTNLTGGTNIQMLCRFTNKPPGHMQLWSVANITTGWE